MSEMEAGHGKPPRASQFRKGQSGNPRGRPRNRQREIPYDYLLGQMVTIREDGRERRITAAEAFLLQLTKKGLEGCNASANASLKMIETARSVRFGSASDEELRVRLIVRSFGLCSIFEDLGIGVILNPASKGNVQLMLRTWIVEMALARMAPNTLSIENQRVVVATTHTPAKVRWPSWWEIYE